MKLRSEALTVAKYRNINTKIDAVEVQAIRWLWLNQGALQSSSVEGWRLSQDDIGDWFEVHQAHISRIVRRHYWADLPQVLTKDEVPEILWEMDLPAWLIQAVEELVADRARAQENMVQEEIPF